MQTSVWIVKKCFRDAETPTIAAWSTRELAVQDAEEKLKSDTSVEKHYDYSNGICAWRSDTR